MSSDLALGRVEGWVAEGGGEVRGGDLGEGDDAGRGVLGLPGIEVEDHHAGPRLVFGSPSVGHEAVCQQSSKG